MAISFQNVTYRYPGSEVGVFGIDLEIEDGELLVVIGPSGSGKTTLLKLLAGFLEAQSGRILVDGESVSGLPPHRRNLGIVFQAYALFQHMTAVQNVAYPLKVRGVPRAARLEQARRALARVGLDGLGGRLPANLSGGQQQRVALARALVFSPRALLLDEPLSALDAFRRAEMRDEIARVQRDAGIATLHVTHDLEEAMSIGDRVAVMHGGRLLQVAAPQTLYDMPVDRRVGAFVGKANLWEATVSAPGWIASPVGALACDTTGFAPGSSVTAMVRPERILPLADPAEAKADGVVLAGAVSLDRFAGPIRRFDMGVGQSVVHGETAGYRGPIAAVQIPSEAIRLLPPETVDA
ncbi:ABC transporter ATP-binding protein [Telmatospirillum siberiense]|uniref:ABC transporter ATP-binding protein n=1 Tax=Telmatospirillum siberiense TaxID=382514 RepID=A0A2N3PVU4_9PROT|nr:ABC transporter ATP-binding protein [Telmatospirillum siberiense]PKU24532.1 ABC transporter ATP-binding protein [Telmatospirillum siberiense]